MIFKLQFPERLAEIRSVRIDISHEPYHMPAIFALCAIFSVQDLEVISTAAITLQHNKNFKKILEVCLYVYTYVCVYVCIYVWCYWGRFGGRGCIGCGFNTP